MVAPERIDGQLMREKRGTSWGWWSSRQERRGLGGSSGGDERSDGDPLCCLCWGARGTEQGSRPSEGRGQARFTRALEERASWCPCSKADTLELLSVGIKAGCVLLSMTGYRTCVGATAGYSFCFLQTLISEGRD